MKTFSMETGKLLPSAISDYEHEVYCSAQLSELCYHPLPAKTMPIDLACVDAQAFLNQMYADQY